MSTKSEDTTRGGLTFADLRAANRARLPQFRNARGELAHSEPDGSDWSIGEWVQAVVGELGEFANLAKKVRRGDIDMTSARPELADELADVVTYLDILAMQIGVDLGAAVASKSKGWRDFITGTDGLRWRSGIARATDALARTARSCSTRCSISTPPYKLHGVRSLRCLVGSRSSCVWKGASDGRL